MSAFNDPYGSTSFPIYQTATFDVSVDKYDYTRSGNPNRDLLQNEIKKLYKADYSLAFSSGMASILALTKLVKSGERIICASNTYGGTYRLLNSLKDFGVIVEFMDIFVDEKGNTDTSHLVPLIQDEKTKLIFVESLSNPFMKFVDIPLISQIIKQQKSNCLLAVDNSFLSSILCNPLQLGAHIVMESLTKFTNGTGDCMGGVLVTNIEDLNKQLYFYLNAYGLGLNPYNCWLIQRNIPTMRLRVEKQQENTTQIYEFLKDKHWVKQIYYPSGLSTPQLNIFSKISSGFGSILTFSTDIAEDIFNKTIIFQKTVSFGSVFSKIELPYKMSHFCVSEDIIPNNLVRLSIGLEDPTLLIKDISQ